MNSFWLKQRFQRLTSVFLYYIVCLGRNRRSPPFHTRIAETVVWVWYTYFCWNRLLKTFRTFLKWGFYYVLSRGFRI